MADMFQSASWFCVVLGLSGALNPVLVSNSTSAVANYALKLTCNTSETVVTWLRKPIGGNTFEDTLIASSGSSCGLSPPQLPDVFAECDCDGSTFFCILKPLSMTNNGDKWKCSVSVGGEIKDSQEITIAVTAQTTQATTQTQAPGSDGSTPSIDHNTTEGIVTNNTVTNSASSTSAKNTIQSTGKSNALWIVVPIALCLTFVASVIFIICVKKKIKT